MATDSEKLKWQKIDEMRRRLGYEWN
jgi:hypothetical protein